MNYTDTVGRICKPNREGSLCLRSGVNYFGKNIAEIGSIVDTLIS